MGIEMGWHPEISTNAVASAATPARVGRREPAFMSLLRCKSF
jgi:hypothetical protein